MKKDKSFSASGLNDREAVQRSEGYDTSVSSYPDDRLQRNKQDLSPTQLGVDSKEVYDAGKVSKIVNASNSIRSKVKVKPDASVDVLDGKQVGGVPLSNGLQTRSFSGAGSVSPADDISRNPSSQGGLRASSRYGKKVSDLNFEINNTISEQIAPQYDESKDLREAPDSVQGYNGRKQFTQARGKKNAGEVPMDLLYDRSADIITHDEYVYSDGQILDSIPYHANYPTKTFVGKDADMDNVDMNGYVPVDCKMDKGNYSLDGFTFTLKDGKLTDVHFSETRFIPKTTRLERDAANMNWQVDSNNITSAMVKLQTQLGRETTDKWSPLGYVIEEPYQYNTLYHDMENTTGAVLSMAYRSAVTAMEHQLNLLSKDGANSVDPAFGMFAQGIGEISNSASYANASLAADTGIYSSAMLRAGSASAYIKMFDSVGKYKTKADFLTQPRSLKLALSQVDNNLNPMHVKKEFMKAVNAVHTYSTVDGSYSPVLPVYATRKVTLVNPLSLNYFLEGWQNPHSDGFDSTTHDMVTGTAARYTYSYSDIRVDYVMPVKNPLVEGLLKWMLDHEGALASAYGSSGTVTVNMPASFNFLYPTMFTWMLCSASQDIAYYRNVYFKDILFAGDQMSYIWDDLSPLSEVNPLYSTQLTIGKYDEALKVGKLTNDALIRTMYPECFQVCHGTNGSLSADIRMPWYFNEEQFNATVVDGSYLREEGFATMTMPSIRDEVRSEAVDALYSMTERDVRLAIDRMVTIPVPTSTTDYDGLDPDVYVPIGGTFVPQDVDSDKIHINAVRFDLASDGRVVVAYDQTKTGTDRYVTYGSLLCVPRELGFICPAPSASMSFIGVSGDGSVEFASDLAQPAGANWYVPYILEFDGSTTWTLTSYFAHGQGASGGITTTSIGVTAALQQEYIRCFASRNPSLVGENVLFLSSRGYYPAISALLAADSLNTLRTATTSHKEFYALRSGSDAALSSGSNVNVVTFAPVIWSILQRVQFAVNPFENSLVVSNPGTDVESGVLIDPMELAFWFGFSGTLASDFNQDILERLNTFTQLGINYLEDNFVKDSLIFRA